MRKIYLLPISIVFIGSILVSEGCKKDTPASKQANSTITQPAAVVDTDYSAATDDATATFIINDAKVIADASVEGQSVDAPRKVSVKAVLSSCSRITFASDTVSSDTCYINFGASDCVCNDGRKRRGEIIVYWNKLSGSYMPAYFDSANTIQTTFNNYYVDDIGVSGISLLTNEGKNAMGTQNWRYTVNITLQYFSGETATWNAARNGILIEMSGAYYYEITGSAIGVDHAGYSYAQTITNPLYEAAQPWYLGGCPWVESGIANINRSNSTNTLTLNYGTTGICDDTAAAVINGNNFGVILP